MDLFSRLIGIYILFDILRQVAGMVFRVLRDRMKSRISFDLFHSGKR